MVWLCGFQFYSLETVINALIDEFPNSFRGRHERVSLTVGVCFVEFLLGILLVTAGGPYIQNLIDWYASSFSILCVGVLECIVVSWVYGEF